MVLPVWLLFVLFWFTVFCYFFRAGTRFAQVRARTEFAGEHRRPGVAGRAARSCMMVERTPRYIRPGPATLKSPGRDTAPGPRYATGATV